MAPYEALYGAPCRTPTCWTEAEEKPLDKLDIVEEIETNTKETCENIQVSWLWHKQYADKCQKPIEFQTEYMVML